MTSAPPLAVKPAGAGLVPGLALATTLVLWASAFVAIRHLGSEVGPGALSLGRLLIGGVVLSGFLLGRVRTRLTRLEIALLLVCGSSWFGVYNLALNASEQRIDAATAAMLVQVGPLLIAFLAALFLGERLSGWFGAGMLVAFGGVLVIGQATRADGTADPEGVLLAVVAAVAFAVGVVCQKVLLRRLTALEVTTYSCWIGALVCLPWWGDLSDVVRQGSGETLGLILYLGVFPTAIAFSTWAYALSRTEASRQAVTTFLVPVMTALIAWVLLAESAPALAWVGGACCVAGVALARRRPRIPAAGTP